MECHHFRSFVSDGRIVINAIDSPEQLADILAKPLQGGIRNAISDLNNDMVSSDIYEFFNASVL